VLVGGGGGAGVPVSVGVGVLVGDGVGVLVGVTGVGVSVGSGVSVGVGVIVGVSVAGGVAVNVGWGVNASSTMTVGSGSPASSWLKGEASVQPDKTKMVTPTISKFSSFIGFFAGDLVQALSTIFVQTGERRQPAGVFPRKFACRRCPVF